MEARKLTIVSSQSQKKSVIMSKATTLAELKRDLRDNNISYDGMTFFEGTSKTELKSDDSVLPHDVPFKGQTTNELVFMLTNTNKKIRSGAKILTRKEAGAFFKADPITAFEFKKAHGGKNWTNCGTADILNWLNKGEKETSKAEKPAPKKEAPKAVKHEPKEASVSEGAVKNAIKMLVEVLYDNEYICGEDKKEIINVLNGGKVPEKLESEYSDDDIDDMFKDMI